jgi:hypothetical protein
MAALWRHKLFGLRGKHIAAGELLKSNARGSFGFNRPWLVPNVPDEKLFETFVAAH